MIEVSKLIRQYIDFFEQLNINQHIDNSEYLIDLKTCENEIKDYLEQLKRSRLYNWFCRCLFGSRRISR